MRAVRLAEGPVRVVPRVSLVLYAFGSQYQDQPLTSVLADDSYALNSNRPTLMRSR